jgi:polysaccharide biosynthesis/export protein
MKIARIGLVSEVKKYFRRAMITNILLNQTFRRSALVILSWFLLGAFIILTDGCAGTHHSGTGIGQTRTDEMTLREGDKLKISFPASPALNTIQQIRRDGKISMSLVGDVEAAGKTPDELKQDLIRLYASQISSKEVIVEVDSSTFPIYVSGSVLRPGKIVSDRPITVMEAVMEAGVDYTAANLKSVRVIRREHGVSQSHTVNLKEALDGKDVAPFYLEPDDVVFVPEKFTFF